MKVIVIIPAAGLGTRMAAATAAKKRKPAPSKQFTELGGVPILLHTLRKFSASPYVAEIYIALRKDEITPLRERLEKEASDVLAKKVELVEGGEHRQQSVANALAAVSAAPDDIVLVHDAVRPFVTAELIEEVIHGAEKYGAAIAGVPAVAASTEPAPKAASPQRITGIRPNRSEMAPPGRTMAATASR